MSKLKTEEREDLSDSKFALPEERKYPVEDKAHARNAKARAARQEKAGSLSAADRRKVDAKADKVLGKDEPPERLWSPPTFVEAMETTFCDRGFKVAAATIDTYVRN